MELKSTSVALVQCEEYDQQALMQAIDRMWSASCTPQNLRGALVLLKPNLITAQRGLLACTEGRFILAAAKWFLEQGSRVAVGDSPAFGTVEGILGSMNIVTALRQAGVRITDFAKTRPVYLPSGLKVALAAEALDCDLLVNLPRVKAHVQMRVTLAVKNYFGCVGGIRKPLWHMVYGGKHGRFADYLAELLTVLPSGITLVDGITAMHRTGPSGGEPFSLGLSACSANPIAVDSALLQIIGVSSETSPLMMACQRAGLAGTDFRQLIFPLLAPEALQVKGFVVPEELIPVRFNPFHFVKNNIRRLLIRLKFV